MSNTKQVIRSLLFLVVFVAVISVAARLIFDQHIDRPPTRSTLQGIEEMLRKLERAAGVPANNISIEIANIPGKGINAGIGLAESGPHIVISKKLIDSVRNDHQLAFILAHELAHALMGHLNGDGDALFPPFYKERWADTMAFGLVQMAGYKACHAKGVFYVLDKLNGQDGTDPTDTHPSSLQREYYLFKGC